MKTIHPHLECIKKQNSNEGPYLTGMLRRSQDGKDFCPLPLKYADSVTPVTVLPAKMCDN
jgi:hypothetical protein